MMRVIKIAFYHGHLGQKGITDAKSDKTLEEYEFFLLLLFFS